MNTKILTMTLFTSILINVCDVSAQLANKNQVLIKKEAMIKEQELQKQKTRLNLLKRISDAIAINSVQGLNYIDGYIKTDQMSLALTTIHDKDGFKTSKVHCGLITYEDLQKELAKENYKIEITREDKNNILIKISW